MLQIRAICRPCRLQLKSWPCVNFRIFKATCVASPQHLRPAPASYTFHPFRRAITTDEHARSISTDDAGVDADLLPKEESSEDLTQSEDERLQTARAQIGPEAVARHARLRFGDRLPENALNEQEYKIYERLFGKPLSWSPEHEEEDFAEESDDETVLLKESADGSLEEVSYTPIDPALLEGVDPELRQDIEAALSEPRDQGDGIAPDAESDADSQDTAGGLRTHPFTLAARSGTNPSTISLPAAELARPVAALLSDISNKHLRETGERSFGGPGLPYSTGTPKVSRTMPQKPIPLSPFQSKMAPMEADAFMAAVMPGVYASVMSVLVETRRVLGSSWLEKLLLKEDGPSVLDAGAGGAGVLAWHQVLHAEWDTVRKAKGAELGIGADAATPLGKATVLTSSDSLRHRASALLDNTTFLPRLPDYVHVEPRKPGEPGMPHGRKQFDIILAPHSLWSLPDVWQRRQLVQNLWALLNEDGGVLVLLEKGVTRGFEVVADARQYLLEYLFLNADKDTMEEQEEAEVDASGLGQQPRSHHRHASPGAIVAPCTTHSKCPMYRVPGVSRQRKDHCHFSQRYHRPSYQQNILGAKSRNHEDVEFSYISVMRGRRPEELGVVQSPDGSGARRARLQGKLASDRAFAGYELGDADLGVSEGPGIEAAVMASTKLATDNESVDLRTDAASVLTTPLPETPAPHALTLPRLVLPALKKRGHVLMDVCTPAGTLERWSVTRSYGPQAYRDARKSAWGDLWALGAKSRSGRRVRVGKGTVMDGSTLQEEEAAMDEAEVAEMAKHVEGQQRKLRGREKARARKREERKAMGEVKRRRRKPAAADDEEEDD